MRIPTIKSRKHHSPLELAIVELDVSLKTANILENASVLTVEDYLKKSRSKLSEIKNFGPKALSEMKLALRQVGIEAQEEELVA